MLARSSSVRTKGKAPSADVGEADRNLLFLLICSLPLVASVLAIRKVNLC